MEQDVRATADQLVQQATQAIKARRGQRVTLEELDKQVAEGTRGLSASQVEQVRLVLMEQLETAAQRALAQRG